MSGTDDYGPYSPEREGSVLRSALVSSVVIAVVSVAIFAAIGDGMLWFPKDAAIFLLIWAITIMGALLAIVRASIIIRDGVKSWLRARLFPEPQAGALAGDSVQIGQTDPADMFGEWLRHRLIYSPGATVTANDAYSNYARQCQFAGMEPMSSVQFGKLLTAHAEASGGRIRKSKAGSNKYNGVTLAGSDE